MGVGECLGKGKIESIKGKKINVSPFYFQSRRETETNI